jgi:ADP-heptose:LPS heptosyltransferase
MRALARRLVYCLPPLWRIRLRKRATLLYDQAGYGDTLMAAAVARELKQAVPGIHITMNRCKASLLHGNPFVDAVGDSYDGIDLNYHYGPHNAGESLSENLIEAMGRKAGLRNISHSVNFFPAAKERAYARALCRDLPRPIITIQAGAGPFAAGRKDWPIEYWHNLVEALRARNATTLQLGAKGDPVIDGARDLTGALTIRQSFALIEHADLHAGVVSSCMHGAAAVGATAVILYGGFERASAHDYPTVIALESHMPCAPCIRAHQRILPCPIGVECMKSITPEKALAAINAALRRRDIAAPDSREDSHAA